MMKLVSDPNRTAILPSNRIASWESLKEQRQRQDAPDGPSPLILPEKSSADLLDYTVSFGLWFGGTGDSLCAAVITGLEDQTSDTPLTAANITFDASTATFVLTSGTPGEVYNFSLQIKTEMGRIFNAPLQILINNNSLATQPQPYDAAPSFDEGIFTSWLTALPPSPPQKGGWWNNAGIPCLTEAKNDLP